MIRAWEADILNSVAARAKMDIIEQEDQRALAALMGKEVTMSRDQHAEVASQMFVKNTRPELDVEAMRSTLRKMKKDHIIEHAINAARRLDNADEAHRQHLRGIQQRDEELTRAHELLEFWRAKAFEFQKQVNDLMGLIAPREDV